MMRKTYTELCKLKTLKERFDYLNQASKVAVETFGNERYLNQTLYTSKEWKSTRRKIIERDDGKDMAHPDYEITGPIIVHHINAITPEMILNRSPELFDPENLVCVSRMTHEAITYGSKDLLPEDYIERKPNDTCLWRKET